MLELTFIKIHGGATTTWISGGSVARTNTVGSIGSIAILAVVV
jgi:hypothetical protein